jgi:hypothetical protein
MPSGFIEAHAYPSSGSCNHLHIHLNSDIVARFGLIDRSHSPPLTEAFYPRATDLESACVGRSLSTLFQRRGRTVDPLSPNKGAVSVC